MAEQRDFEAEIAKFIRPERLEAVMARPVPKFGGKTSRQLIAEGRGEELLASFKESLDYSGTA